MDMAGLNRETETPFIADSEHHTRAVSDESQPQPQNPGSGVAPCMMQCITITNVAQSYSEVSPQPGYYCLATNTARFAYGCILIIYWCVGWRIAGVDWLWTIPAIVDAALVWLEILRVLTLGPLEHTRSWIAKVAEVSHAVTFSYVTLVPIFQPVDYKPFGVRYAAPLLVNVVHCTKCLMELATSHDHHVYAEPGLAC